tara:strand:+ start:13804 stop:17217 length:3414 start_codon:yes stop_codon:yes gene_type:complete
MGESLNNNFVHFKIHSQFSICEGAIKIDNLKDHCKINKFKSLGICDTSNLSGALEFSETISKQGTQPIIGTQIIFNYKNERGHLTLIPKNESGYKKVIKLSSMSYLENDNTSEPHCNINELFRENSDFILMSGTINGLIGKLFVKGYHSEIEEIYKKLSNNFKNNFYIEIQRHNDLNEKSFEKFNLNLSYKLDIPIIASHEVFYIDQSMHDAHEALICIREKTYVNEKNRLSYSDQHYLKPDNEMKILFQDIPEALLNNYNLPFRINFRPLKSDPVLPNISSNKDGNADTMLSNNSLNGLNQKFKYHFCNSNQNPVDHELYKDYKSRLDHELKIILEMNYSSYFLIVADYINWAKKNDIPVGPGRGSGAGSLVAWSLSITDVDPIKFNLIFERFLNPARISMPDFDIDFCEEKRDLVFNYLASKYKDSVAHIITFGKLKARMVIRDVGRVLGLPYGFVDSIAKLIPFDPSRPQNLIECINSEPRLKKMIDDDNRVKKLINLSLKLEGLNRNVATHAAGVVIADKKLTETVPLYKDQSTNLLLPSTQFDMYSAENAGLIKFDFLGLKTLTVINKTEKIIKKKVSDFSIDKISYDDQNVFKTLSKGQTVGLFQLESSGMKDALVNMKPTHLEDIIALVALYRPGPMSNIPTYNECKNGNLEPDYIHPLLEEILKPTYGVIIYQEQIMQIAQKLSGFSAAEADILRKAIGKKKRVEVEKQKIRFVDGAVKNGIRKDVAAGIFLKIEPFAEYGFNKSHAAAYAIIAYQTAYLKTYFQNEFFAASMTMDISNQKKLGEFYEEIKRLGIKIIRPDINCCFADFRSFNSEFFYALGAIKNVGFEAISNVVEERENNGKFKSIADFIRRVNPKDINKLQLEGLVKAGAFDSLNKNRASLLESIPNLIQKSKNFFDNKSLSQINLFENPEEKDLDILSKIDDWKFEDRLNKEFEAIGFFVSDHPLNQFSEIYNQYKILNFNEFFENKNLHEGNVLATVLKVQEKKTSKGLSYAIIKFSDLKGVFELFVFSEILERNRSILVEGKSLFLSLIKNIDKDKKNLRVNIRNINLINDLLNKPIEKIEIDLKNIEDFTNLSSYLMEQGNTEVCINYLTKDKNVKFVLENKRKVDLNTVKLLKNLNISLNIF